MIRTKSQQQPDPSMDEEDSVPADGDDGQEELGLVEQSVAELSGLDELAAQLSKPSKRMADAGSMEVSEAMADLDEVLESELKRLKPTVPSLLKMPWEMGFAGMVLGGSEVSLVPARVRVGIQAPTGKVPEGQSTNSPSLGSWKRRIEDPERKPAGS